MAVVFGGATTNAGRKTTPSSGMNSMAAFSVLAWVYPTTLTSGRTLWARIGTSNVGTRILLSGTGGNIEVIRTHATTNADYITSDTPLATLNKWYCVAVTGDTAGAAGQQLNIYVGDSVTPLVESAYGTSTDGVGALSSDSAGAAVYLGNDLNQNVAWRGRIGAVGVINSLLAIGRLQDWQYYPREFAGMLGFWNCGSNELTNVPDQSGNGNLLTFINTAPTLGSYSTLRRPGR